MSIDPKSSYYDVGNIETIDIIKAKLTSEQYEGYLLGNMIKYSCRCMHKGSMKRDIEKVGVYSKQLEEKINGQTRSDNLPLAGQPEYPDEHFASPLADVGKD